MFKSKKIFKILLAVSLTSSILVGCGAKTEVVPVRLETPEEVVDTFIKDLKENNTSEMARLYADVYVDSTGYDLYTIEKILSKSRKESELVDIELTNMEDYNDTIKNRILAAQKPHPAGTARGKHGPLIFVTVRQAIDQLAAFLHDG